MTAHDDPQVDPQNDAASLDGAPESAEESARARDLAELFGPLVEDDDPLADADDSATREHLAALFGAQSASGATAGAEAEPDFSWQPEHVSSTPEPASAWAREPGMPAVDASAPDLALPRDAAAEAVATPESDSARAAAAEAVATPESDSARAAAAEAVATPESDSARAAAAEAVATPESDSARVEPRSAARQPLADDAQTEVVAGGAVAASALPWGPRRTGAPTEASEVDASSEDSLAWLDRVSREPIDTPEKAALGSWLGTVNGSSDTTVLPAAVAAAATTEHTQVLPEATAGSPAGSFFPAQRRGIRGWSSGVRWSVAVSIVLLIGVVIASVVIAQTISANNLAAQELAAAVADLEAAEESATQPQPVLDEAVKNYNATVATAQATADSAGPPLAAIGGMAAQPLLDASNAALAALVAQLDASALDGVPEPYERGDVDVTDIDAVRAATQAADDHAERLSTATREVTAAQAALQEKLDALRAAQVALGASLPETGVFIVGEYRRALQSFRDAVIAASVAVPAAQNAGGSGDAELLAYAAAVTALREDQLRAEAGTTPVTPPSGGTAPAPEPEPEPAPDPVPPPPDPQPTPEPTPTPDPTVVEPPATLPPTDVP